MNAGVYDNGADYWRDLKQVSVNMETALHSGCSYIGEMMTHECSGDDKRFCHELFAAMYEDTAHTTDPAKLVYPYDIQTANERVETSYYHESRKRNAECAFAIDESIRASCYKPSFYNLELAAMKAALEHGFPRVNLLLAHNLQMRERDGRISSSSMQWARQFPITEKAFGGATLNTHPLLIEGFVTHTRKLYIEVNADRFALPGRPESGASVHGYEITRAVTFDNQRGFAVGLNPTASDQFACWQFTVENGKREYYWGHYSDELGSVVQNYIARTIVHMNGEGARDISALVAETLPDSKPSVAEQIRAAREVPAQPSKGKKAPIEKAPEPER